MVDYPIKCPDCGHDKANLSEIKKSGSKRYRCKKCRTLFTPNPKKSGIKSLDNTISPKKRSHQQYLKRKANDQICSHCNNQGTNILQFIPWDFTEFQCKTCDRKFRIDYIWKRKK